MKNTFNSQDQMSQLQDGERLAATMLTDHRAVGGVLLNPLATTLVVPCRQAQCKTPMAPHLLPGRVSAARLQWHEPAAAIR